MSGGTSSVSGADRSILAGASSSSSSGNNSSGSSTSGSTGNSASAGSGATPRSSGVSSSGNTGNLDGNPSSVVVTVKNTSDLRAVTEAFTLAQSGESLLLEGNTFTRQPGTISLDAGTILERTLTLRNNVITADVIKARGFDNQGRDSLIIEGGQFNAAQTIKLYGDGVSNLRFRGQVQLNSPNSDLAAKRVHVDPGSTVTASGNVRVYSDDHGYNRPGNGSLNATSSQQLPFANRPRF